MRSPTTNVTVSQSRSLKKRSLNSPRLSHQHLNEDTASLLSNQQANNIAATNKRLRKIQQAEQSWQNKSKRQKKIEEANQVSKLTIQNDLLRNRLKGRSSQMDQIIAQETANRSKLSQGP